MTANLSPVNASTWDSQEELEHLAATSRYAVNISYTDVTHGVQCSAY